MILGLTPKYHLGHVISGRKRIEEVILEGPAGLKVVASGSGDYRLANLTERSLENCLQHLNEIEKNTDIMLIDTGAGISRNVLKFVLAAGEVVIVTTPEPTAITDAYGIIKVIASADSNTPIWVVVNMTKDETEGEQVMERLSTVSQRFLGINLANIGFIKFDPNVSRAVKEQQPFIISRPRCAASLDVNNIAKNILNRSVNANLGARGFFERLFGRIR
jgi:flagellar biosynthesis protein FlhG